MGPVAQEDSSPFQGSWIEIWPLVNPKVDMSLGEHAPRSKIPRLSNLDNALKQIPSTLQVADGTRVPSEKGVLGHPKRSSH